MRIKALPHFPKIALALLLAAFLHVPAAAAWTRVRSKNFLLAGDAGEKDIRAVADRLERFRDALRQTYPEISLDRGVPLRVIVFATAASYRDYKPKRADGTPDDAVAGFFLPGDDASYITLAFAGDGSDPLETAAHEYLHAVIDANFHGEVPPWLGEGLAGFFQTLKFVTGQGTASVQIAGIDLRRLRRERLLAVKELTATSSDDLESMPDKARTAFYAESAALVQSLMQTGSVRLGTFLAYLKNGEQGETDFRQTFGKSYAEADEMLLRDFTGKTATTPLAFSYPEVRADGFTASTLSEAEASAYLGDLLGRLDEPDQAAVMLGKALSLDPSLVLANSSFGLLLMRQGEFAEAAKYLAKAAASPAADHVALFNYAYALSRTEADADGNVEQFPAEIEAPMRKALEQAIAREPSFTESYYLLAFVDLVNGSDLGEAARLLRKGLALRPDDPRFEAMLARVLLRQERYGEAKAIAEKVRKNAVDDGSRADADEVLHAVDEYSAVERNESIASDTGIYRMLPLLFLKRSAVTEQDLARFDEDRRINNLNILLGPPRSGEKRITGYIESVTCANDQVSYRIRTADESIRLGGKNFDDVRLAIFTEGESSFRLDCGSSFRKQLAVIAYRPDANSSGSLSGTLAAITFVPDYFRLKTPEQLAKARTVVVEDDTARSSRRAAAPKLSTAP